MPCKVNLYIYRQRKQICVKHIVTNKKSYPEVSTLYYCCPKRIIFQASTFKGLDIINGYFGQGAFQYAFDDSGCSSAVHCTRVPKKNAGNEGSDDLYEPKTDIEPEHHSFEKKHLSQIFFDNIHFGVLT